MPDLGSYAFEVLTSYAVGLGLLAFLIIASYLQSRRAKRALQKVEKDD